jgi:hypothetical protein
MPDKPRAVNDDEQTKVDFPLPDGPTTDTNSPLFTEKLTLFRDTTLPDADTYTLVRFSTFIVTEAV